MRWARLSALLCQRRVVWLSYGVASSYVLADAIDKGKKAGEVPSPEAGRSARVTVAVVDTFVWQALASVAIPGFTINRVCAASLYVLGTATRWPLAVRKWTTTALGLLTIPIIIHPIDRSVDFLLDSSLRKSTQQWGSPAPPDHTLVPGLCIGLLLHVNLLLLPGNVDTWLPGVQRPWHLGGFELDRSLETKASRSSGCRESQKGRT
nr:HSPC242 [Homo sapiens]